MLIQSQFYEGDVDELKRMMTRDQVQYVLNYMVIIQSQWEAVYNNLFTAIKDEPIVGEQWSRIFAREAGYRCWWRPKRLLQQALQDSTGFLIGSRIEPQDLEQILGRITSQAGGNEHGQNVTPVISEETAPRPTAHTVSNVPTQDTLDSTRAFLEQFGSLDANVRLAQEIRNSRHGQNVLNTTRAFLDSLKQDPEN